MSKEASMDWSEETDMYEYWSCKICQNERAKLQSEITLLRLELNDLFVEDTIYTEQEKELHELHCPKNEMQLMKLKNKKTRLLAYFTAIKKKDLAMTEISKRYSQMEIRSMWQQQETPAVSEPAFVQQQQETPAQLKTTCKMCQDEKDKLQSEIRSIQLKLNELLALYRHEDNVYTEQEKELHELHCQRNEMELMKLQHEKQSLKKRIRTIKYKELAMTNISKHLRKIKQQRQETLAELETTCTQQQKETPAELETICTQQQQETPVEFATVCLQQQQEIPAELETITTQQQEEAQTWLETICSQQQQETPVEFESVFRQQHQKIPTNCQTVCTQQQQETPVELETVCMQQQQETPVELETVCMQQQQETQAEMETVNTQQKQEIPPELETVCMQQQQESLAELETFCRVCQDEKDKIQSEIMLLQLEVNKLLAGNYIYTEQEKELHKLHCRNNKMQLMNLTHKKKMLQSFVSASQETDLDISKFSKLENAFTQTPAKGPQEPPASDSWGFRVKSLLKVAVSIAITAGALIAVTVMVTQGWR